MAPTSPQVERLPLPPWVRGHSVRVFPPTERPPPPPPASAQRRALLQLRLRHFPPSQGSLSLRLQLKELN
jgi:hypothetical protein